MNAERADRLVIGASSSVRLMVCAEHLCHRCGRMYTTRNSTAQWGESKGERNVLVFGLSCGLRALPLSLRGGRQIRQLWISDALQMKTAAAQVARRQLKLGCRPPSTKAIGRSRERSNYAAPAGKDTMCCEGLGTFGAVIGGAEFRCH